MPPIDIACGICGAVLYRDLRSYVKAPPSQRHLTCELYTMQPPLADAVAPMRRVLLLPVGVGGADVEVDAETLDGQPPNPRTVNCVRNCHARHGLYLIDAGTGSVDLHGFGFGIAVGRARGGQSLAVATPAAAPAPAPPPQAGDQPPAS